MAYHSADPGQREAATDRGSEGTPPSANWGELSCPRRISRNVVFGSPERRPDDMLVGTFVEELPVDRIKKIR